MAAVGGEPGDFCRHHSQLPVCATRAKYREGRRPRAVKVYTINLESRYLLVQGVPALGVMKELVEQFALYGAIEQYNALDQYPAEEFTDVYLIKFQKLQSARVAKRKLDERSFFGGLLHVCYAPEFETVQETREKLQDRQRYIARATGNRANSLFGAKKKPEGEPPAPRSLLLGHRLGLCPAAPGSPGGPHPERFPLPLQPPPHHHPPPFLAGESWQRRCPEPRQRGPPGKAPDSWGQRQQADPPDNGIGRFLPRTTQLQERRRRREEDRDGDPTAEPTDPGRSERLIGPLLPTLPALDLGDASLNTSAGLIQKKLREVAALPRPQPSESRGDEVPDCPRKQRRRI
ncbi:RNA-binding protein 48 [Tachyglossus aculeatus]|uniref:RNA-binding protein 48 n=1 Tax=Tachyglossus aculeatus TaxID=9261 RepID=UPI0018F50438|nr:RNA-binding protein 48 [Tachyglossus aculeatus]